MMSFIFFDILSFIMNHKFWIGLKSGEVQIEAEKYMKVTDGARCSAVIDFFNIICYYKYI